jgi:hypothetical protein
MHTVVGRPTKPSAVVYILVSRYDPRSHGFLWVYLLGDIGDANILCSRGMEDGGGVIGGCGHCTPRKDVIQLHFLPIRRLPTAGSRLRFLF